MESSATELSGKQIRARERAEFLRKTYYHFSFLFFAFLLLTIFVAWLPIHEILGSALSGSEGFLWLAALIVLVLYGFGAEYAALKFTSAKGKYIVFGLTPLVGALCFWPVIHDLRSLETSNGVFLGLAAAVAGLALATALAARVAGKDFVWNAGWMIFGLMALGLAGAYFILELTFGLFVCGIVSLLLFVATMLKTLMLRQAYRKEEYVAAAISLFTVNVVLLLVIVRVILEMIWDHFVDSLGGE